MNDQDRLPWLRRLNDLITGHLGQDKSLILACSALKRSYREILREGIADDVRFVYLKGDYDIIHRRMKSRADHYMDAEMLSGQFDSLEEPADALVINVDQPVKRIVNEIISRLG